MSADKQHTEPNHSIAERRNAVRIDVADLRVLSGPPIRIKNLSRSGMLFASMLSMRRGMSAEISLLVPGREGALQLRFVVEHRDDTEHALYRAVFVDLAEEATAAIDSFVHQSLLVDSLDDLVRRYPMLADKSLHPVRDQRRIDALLLARQRNRQSLVVTGEDLQAHARVKLKSFQEGQRLLRVVSLERQVFRLGESLLVSLQADTRSYLFETAMVETSGREHTLLKPSVVFFADKRLEIREALATGALTAILSLPHPPGAVIRAPVLNRSEGGLALEFAAATPIFPGTPVERLQLEASDRGSLQEVGPMVVSHVSAHPYGDSGKVLVGMQHSLPRSRLTIGRWARRSDPPLKHEAASVGPAPFLPGHSAADAPGPPTNQSAHPVLSGFFHSRLVHWLDASGRRVVGRLDTTPNLDPMRPVPTVIVPPASVKTKEAVVGLSMTLVEGFASVGEQLAVVRYDGTFRRGESHNPQSHNPPGQQMLHWTHACGISDLDSALSFVRSGEEVTASQIVLLTFSAAALEARYLLSRGGQEVTLWVPILAVPEFREVSRRVFGGLDVVDLLQLGILPEHLQALGEELDGAAYVKNALDLGLAGMDQARQDMAQISCPVYWIAGQDDGWVDLSQVRDLMTIKPHSSEHRQLFTVETGHQLRTSSEALDVFKMITDLVLRHVAPSARLFCFGLSSAHVEEQSRREQERLQRVSVRDPVSYWHGYLMGHARQDIGYDILRETDDFEEFMRQQAELLDVQDGDVVGDLGTGTGNLAETLVRHCLGGRVPSRLVLSDIVPTALEHAAGKVRAALTGLGLSVPVEVKVANLEHNRLRVVQEFLDGRLYGPRALAGRVSGLGNGVLDQLAERYDQLTHDVLRGLVPNQEQMAKLRQLHGEHVVDHVLEFSRVARLVQGTMADQDLLPETRDHRPNRPLRAADLSFDLLDFGDASPIDSPPFPDQSFDRIALSLVICYLNEPERVLQALRGYLRPGGKIVLSTPRPDMDISGLFVRLVQTISRRRGAAASRLLESARAFSNSAALLLRLEEQGHFFLPDESQLQDAMRKAGFGEIRIAHGFGTPPQAIVATGAV